MCKEHSHSNIVAYHAVAKTASAITEGKFEFLFLKFMNLDSNIIEVLYVHTYVRM